MENLLTIEQFNELYEITMTEESHLKERTKISLSKPYNQGTFKIDETKSSEIVTFKYEILSRNSGRTIVFNEINEKQLLEILRDSYKVKV